MGLLINGQWNSEVNSKNYKGKTDEFRHYVTADGSSGFKAETNRYHLYISLACPWACRTLIMRKLKGLENIISLSIVDPIFTDQGWTFSDEKDCIPDFVNHCQYLHQIYTKAKKDYTGRVTVPVLWDKVNKTIINNESSEILRMFNTEFNDFASNPYDFYPSHLQAAIDKMNQEVFSFVNSGVYKAGFAENQKDYETAFDQLFSELTVLEKILNKSRYLIGDQITEADWRLFTTLVRFDPVYYVHFKCNLYRIVDFPNLSNYLRALYQYPGIAETVNFDQIKRHYYLSHKHINPLGIVPKGPMIDLNLPHNRAHGF